MLLCNKTFQILWRLTEGMQVLPQLKNWLYFNMIKNEYILKNAIVFISFFHNLTLILSWFFCPALGYPKLGRFKKNQYIPREMVVVCK
jgi:hypothetical protein